MSNMEIVSKPKSTRPKYALVKWLGGDDRGKYSIIDSSWLLNFNVTEYEKKNDESYIVEWRDQKKVPLGGWACFDAQVIKLSDSKAAVEKEMKKQIEKPIAFPALLQTFSDDSDADPDYQPPITTDTEVAPAKVPQRRGESSAAAKTVTNPTKPRDSSSKHKLTEEESEKESLKKKVKLLQQENDNLKKENDSLRRQLIEEIPAMLTKVDKLLALPRNEEQPGPSQPGTSVTGKIEILPGTGVYVDIEAWLSAKTCNTPGAFVGRLLVNLFDKQTLLNSNLKGGASKLDPQGGKKQKLDEKKIAALKGAMQTFFPEVKDGQFGTFVNQKITNLRSAEKKAASTTE